MYLYKFKNRHTKILLEIMYFSMILLYCNELKASLPPNLPINEYIPELVDVTLLWKRTFAGVIKNLEIHYRLFGGP